MKSEYTKACIVCGKNYVTKNMHAKYCSKECYQSLYKSIYNERRETSKKQKKKQGMSIAEIDAEAKKAGMTYGKYVVKMGL